MKKNKYSKRDEALKWLFDERSRKIGIDGADDMMSELRRRVEAHALKIERMNGENLPEFADRVLGPAPIIRTRIPRYQAELMQWFETHAWNSGYVFGYEIEAIIRLNEKPPIGASIVMEYKGLKMLFSFQGIDVTPSIIHDRWGKEQVVSRSTDAVVMLTFEGFL